MELYTFTSLEKGVRCEGARVWRSETAFRGPLFTYGVWVLGYRTQTKWRLFADVEQIIGLCRLEQFYGVAQIFRLESSRILVGR